MCYTHVLHGGRWIVKSIAWQAKNWNGARYCKRNFLIKEGKLFLPLWLFSIKWLILYGCEQTFCPQAQLPAPAASPVACTQGTVCVRSPCFEEWFWNKFPLAAMIWLLHKNAIAILLLCACQLHSFRRKDCMAKINGPNERQFLVPVSCFCLILPLLSFSSTHCNFEPRSSVTFATSTAMVLKML